MEDYFERTRNIIIKLEKLLQNSAYCKRCGNHFIVRQFGNGVLYCKPCRIFMIELREGNR